MLLEERIHEALEDLDCDQKVAIHYRFWGNLSILEISKMLGLSYTKTDRLIEQTLKRLRKELSKDPVRFYNQKTA